MTSHSPSVSAVASTVLAAVAHSQTTATRYPSDMSAAIFLWSRSTLAANFACQKTSRVFGIAALPQPAWRCQKQPRTKTTALWRDRTMSGLPGLPRPWILYLKPHQCRAFRMNISGPRVRGADAGHHD